MTTINKTGRSVRTVRTAPQTAIGAALAKAGIAAQSIADTVKADAGNADANKARVAKGQAQKAAIADDALRPEHMVKGLRNNAQRAAWLDIAPLAYAEGKSRAELIAAMAEALGTSPSEQAKLAARNAWFIGRLAARFPSDVFPAGATMADRLAFADAYVTGGKGTRPKACDKAYAAARVAWVAVAAELGLGKGQTQKAKNDGKKAKIEPRAGGNANNGTEPAKALASTPPSAATLAPAKPENTESALCHVMTQALTLMQYCKKYAGIMPSDVALAVSTLHRVTYDAQKADKANKA